MTVERPVPSPTSLADPRTGQLRIDARPGTAPPASSDPRPRPDDHGSETGAVTGFVGWYRTPRLEEPRAIAGQSSHAAGRLAASHFSNFVVSTANVSGLDN